MKKIILNMIFFLKHPILILTKKIKIHNFVNSKQVKIKIFRNGLFDVGSSSFRDIGMIRVDDNAILSVGNNVFFNSNINITCLKKIIIGSNCKFGCNVCILDHDHDYKNDINDFIKDDVVIGDNTWIGANSVICKGVNIGNNCVIGAGSIVTKSIPDNTVLIQKREYFLRNVGE